MIINIPLQIDDAAIQGSLKAEYESKVIDRIETLIDSVLKESDRDYAWGSKKSARNGLKCLISDRVESNIVGFLEENRDAIIEAAAKDLGNRLARSKRGKEILEEVSK